MKHDYTWLMILLLVGIPLGAYTLFAEANPFLLVFVVIPGVFVVMTIFAGALFLSHGIRAIKKDMPTPIQKVRFRLATLVLLIIGGTYIFLATPLGDAIYWYLHENFGLL